ncbi:hypothetical protein NXX53_06650 [Bacteroides salyersiae]|uniref:hypothetical protein n=1 Tax=Bacteroides sp. TaxID=29523 RepID=UPI0025C65E14|nr:hypothetical protein [Bacteroides sp.]MCS2956956.1 hypothetical protein [Bacteroides salyersiae]
MAKKIDYTKHIWEGWTVQDFINDLNLSMSMIMGEQSWQKPFKNREEIKKWCMDHQPYYKKYIPGVVDHFCQQYNIAA